MLHGQAHGLGEFVQQMLMEDVFLDNSKFPTVRNKATNRKRKAPFLWQGFRARTRYTHNYEKLNELREQIIEVRNKYAIKADRA